MIDSVNLWECLTASETLNRKEERYGPNVDRNFLADLGKACRFNMQEFSIKPTEEGWLIEIFGCDIDSLNDKIQILIPKDQREPVKIIKDRAGRLEHHHN